MKKQYLILAGTILLVFVGIILTRNQAFATPEQPLSFSHSVHSANSIQCLYCHSEASRSEIAGIPSLEKCMGCHTFIAKEGEGVQALTAYWDEQVAIPWERVNRQPDFVYFSHQPHILSGLNCEVCHGDVASMEAASPVVRMDMGWCLQCHLEQPEEEHAHLNDCLTCHK